MTDLTLPEVQGIQRAWAEVATAFASMKALDPQTALTAGRPMGEAFEQALAGLLQAVGGLEAAAQGGLGFDDFFIEVADGMIHAQSHLDRRSINLLRDESGLQTTYRIPKVKASLQFAAETSTKRKLNLLVMGKSKEQRESQQHRVELEVVAAPPPPEVLAKLAGVPIQDAVVTNLLERAELKKVVTDALEAATTDSSKDRLGRLRDDFRKLVVLRGEGTYVLVLPMKQPTVQVATVRREDLALTDAGTAAADKLKHLWTLFEELGRRQVESGLEPKA